MRLLGACTAFLLCNSIAVAQDVTDPYFDAWTQQEALDLLGFNLPPALYCPHYGRNDFPLHCLSESANVSILARGKRDNDPSSWLFSRDTYDWQFGPGQPGYDTLEMSWGEPDRGFINCRSWLSFDPYVLATVMHASCFVEPGLMSRATHVVEAQFRLEIFTYGEVTLAQPAFLDLVASISREMLK